MNPHFENYLLDVTKSSSCIEIEYIQSLWSGYGKISRYQLKGGVYETIVIKCISLTHAGEHPRGWETDLSHNRKEKSYEVETHWYEKWNQVCDSNCRTPKFIGLFSKCQNHWIVLEDLDVDFPIRKQQLGFSEVKVCLQWLANFHATFLNQKPIGLWKIGTYWNLNTRPDEFEKIEHQELKSKAHLIDDALNQCKYQTIVHGDAKLANFCFSKNSEQVAGVDFQYVGGGCGMKDVAYFLGSCLSSKALELYETDLLDYYFLELKKALEAAAQHVDFKELEQEWRTMYPMACADFTRFLLGWMPSHQKVNKYQLDILQSVLGSLLY